MKNNIPTLRKTRTSPCPSNSPPAVSTSLLRGHTHINQLETLALEVELRQRNKMTLWDAQIYALDNYHAFRQIEYTNQDIYDYFIECVHPLEWHEEQNAQNGD